MNQRLVLAQLPRISEKLLQRLEEIGVNDILRDTRRFPELNEIQQRVRDCVVNGTLYLDKEIKNELGKLIYPINLWILKFSIRHCPYTSEPDHMK